MESLYVQCNPAKNKQTATASKYPQGYFKPKPCKECGTPFTPNAPSECYCNDLCKGRGHTSNYLRRTYGISLKTYEQMHADQKGLCKICNQEGFTMADHHNCKLVVDHCHSGGHVRGLLCHNCNRGIGLLQDSTTNLLNAVTYLERATTIPTGSTLQAIGSGSALPLIKS